MGLLHSCVNRRVKLQSDIHRRKRLDEVLDDVRRRGRLELVNVVELRPLLSPRNNWTRLLDSGTNLEHHSQRGVHQAFYVDIEVRVVSGDVEEFLHVL